MYAFSLAGPHVPSRTREPLIMIIIILIIIIIIMIMMISMIIILSSLAIIITITMKIIITIIKSGVNRGQHLRRVASGVSPKTTPVLN